jgi:hypothetical protein
MKKAMMRAAKKMGTARTPRVPKVIRGARPSPPVAKAGPVEMNGISENDELDDSSVVGVEDEVRLFFGEALE